MSDYTLSVKIDGDASGLESAAKGAETSIEKVETTAEKAGGGAASKFASSAGTALGAVGTKFEDFGKKMTGAGKGLSLGVTAPLTGFYAASAKAFEEVDAGEDTIIKKTGATGEALEGMTGIMKNLAGEIPTDFATAGEAVGEVNTRFGATGEELEDLSGRFLKFAQLNDTNVSGSIDGVQQMMAAFGLESKDTGAVLDTLNKVGQDTGISMETLMQSAVTNGAAFKEMGFNLSDTLGFLGKLETSGVDSSAVMTGLKKSLANAAKEGKPMNEALAEIQDSIKGAGSETEAMQIAMELFGNKAGPAIAQAVREGKLSFEDFGTSITDNLGNVEQTFEGTLDPADKWKTAMNGLKGELAGVAEVVQGQLTPYIEKGTGFVKNLVAKFNELPESAQNVIGKIGIFAAALGPFLVILGTVTSTVGSLIGASGLGGLITMLGGISAPVIAVVAVIAALVAAFIYLWNTNEEFRNSILEIWGQITETFTTFFTTVQEKLAGWGITWGSTIEFIKGLWQGLCDFLAPLFVIAFDFIAGYFKAVCDIIIGVLDFFHGLFTGNWEEMWTGVKEIFGGLIDLIKNAFEHFSEAMEYIAKNFKEIAIKIFEALKEKAGEIFQALKERAIEKFTELKERAVEKFEEIKEKIKEKVEGAKESALETFENIKEGIGEKVDGIKEAVEQGFQNAIDYITGLPEQAFSWGSDIVNSIADGIWDAVGAVTDAASNIAETIWSYIHFSEPEIGPLKNFHTFMPDMMKGLADGMRQNLPTLEAGVSMVADRMTGIIPGTGTAGRYDGTDDHSTHNLGGIYVTVNGAAGQDENALADIVAQKIMDKVVLAG